MSEEHKRKDEEAEPRFDLRDGFGKEDIHAILIFLWNIIKIPLKIIIWPYIWIWRQLGRLLKFLKIKHDNALNEDERQFVESVPLFYSTIGVFAGIFWAVLLALMWIPQELDVDLSDLGSVWDGIKKIFVGDDDTKGIFDYIGEIWGWFSDTVVEIGEGIADNPIASLIFLSIVGFILIILWFFLTESGILSTIFTPFIRGFRAIWRAPVSIWNGIVKRYSSANHYLAGIVLGHDRLENLSQRYWQKVLLFTTLLAIYTFVVGVILTISYSEGWETWEIALYFSLVLFICGVVGGVIELGLLSRILGVLSKEKYLVTLPP